MPLEFEEILPDETTLPSYVDAEDYEVLAAALPAAQVAALAALDDLARSRLLSQASRDIDAAGPWQGQKCSADQDLEFPRIWERGIWGTAQEDGTYAPSTAVKLASIHQAQSLAADPERQELADAAHDGVTGHTAGSLSQQLGGRVPVLCRLAEQLMRPYRLRTGALL